MSPLTLAALRHRVVVSATAPLSLLPWLDWAAGQDAARTADARALLACYLAWEAEDALELELDAELELAWDAAVAA